MGEKSACDMIRDAKIAAEVGADCLEMSLLYLQDKSYCGRVASIDEAQAGDLLVFTGKDGISLVVYIGNGRGYSVGENGKAAVLRVRDLLLQREFLAGVKLGR